MQVKINSSWSEVLKEEFEKVYFQEIRDQLKLLKNQGKVIYPSGSLIFNAFNLTPFDQVKVVIIGQDPYHGEGEAMGLCFSVPKGIKIPPSLKNIYKEIQSDIGGEIPNHGDLTHWAQQGVLLLNASLTVEKDKANAHKDIGWYKFTNAVISLLSEKKQGLVFMLWGNFAKQKKEFIDSNKHLILEAAHPSPLAGGAFFSCKHFSKSNAYLKQENLEQIKWN